MLLSRCLTYRLSITAETSTASPRACKLCHKSSRTFSRSQTHANKHLTQRPSRWFNNTCGIYHLVSSALYISRLVDLLTSYRKGELRLSGLLPDLTAHAIFVQGDKKSPRLDKLSTSSSGLHVSLLDTGSNSNIPSTRTSQLLSTISAFNQAVLLQ